MVDHGAYLCCLAVGLIGLYLADVRWRLALPIAPKRTLTAVFQGVLFFLTGDMIGVHLDIFYPGSNKWLLGVRIYHNIPIEEVFFLTLLCYSSLLIWRGMVRHVHLSRT